MEDFNVGKDSGSITFKKTTLWKIGTFVFAALFVISLFTGGFGIGSSVTGGTVDIPNIPDIPTGIASVNAEDFIDDDPVLGDKNAKLTIIEFSDFQCPFCKRARDDAIKQLEEQYIKTGKVKLVYRDFPLTSIHPMAQKSAEAAECADDQGKFWEYHDVIFERQASLSINSLKQWASELGLKTDDFNKCLDSGKYTNEVNKDASDAQRAGGQGTPYFIIGNQPLSGAQPFAAFQAAIESQL
ncbi:DsbA family protein [Candidatus Woesearchaeota archaeon]|nr:DsbA family protein [Candidatus Woesearchaeota archaeon]